MKLTKIISLSNNKTRLRLFAMIRSLRNVGCNLPVWVIPYDNDRFDLPTNCTWWEETKLTAWLNGHNARKVMRKYQCLLEENYQFVDSDVIFLRNPEEVLQPHNGFITSCCHWHNTGHTTSPELLNFFDATTTVWQQKVFNSGQYACDKILYDFDELKKVAEQPAYKPTCIDFKFHEQPGLNLLVNCTHVPVSNLTLQPYCMESTWAGDYNDENYERFWIDENRKPYLLHWAGCQMNINRPVDKLFLEYLTVDERNEWDKQIQLRVATQNKMRNRLYGRLKNAKAALKLLFE